MFSIFKIYVHFSLEISRGLLLKTNFSAGDVTLRKQKSKLLLDGEKQRIFKKVPRKWYSLGSPGHVNLRQSLQFVVCTKVGVDARGMTTLHRVPPADTMKPKPFVELFNRTMDFLPFWT